MRITGAPGSGKTFALAHRVAGMLYGGAQPERIFFMSILENSAADIRRKLDYLMDMLFPEIPMETIQRVRAGNLNSLAYSLLRRYGSSVLGISSEFRVWGEAEALAAIREEAKEDLALLGVSIDEVNDILGWYRSMRAGAPQPVAQPLPTVWQEVLEIYHQLTHRRGSIDIADIMPMAVEAVKKLPDIANALHKPQSAHFVVDDFQNISPTGYHLLSLISGPRNSLTVAGDSNSTIGQSGGADGSVFDQFGKDYPDFQHTHPPYNHRFGTILYEVTVALTREGSMAPISIGHEKGKDLYRGNPIRTSETPRLVEVDGSLDDMYALLAAEIGSRHRSGIDFMEMLVLSRRLSTINGLKPHLHRMAIPYIEGADFGQVKHPGGVKLRTVHAAQGCQSSHVWILGASDDDIPGPVERSDQYALREEQRIFYVAATRASVQLEFWFRSDSPPSRFLQPVEHLLQRITIPPAGHSHES